jgi:hypothetical protein
LYVTNFRNLYRPSSLVIWVSLSPVPLELVRFNCI